MKITQETELNYDYCSDTVITLDDLELEMYLEEVEKILELEMYLEEREKHEKYYNNVRRL